MTLPASLFGMLIYAATALVAVAPLILLVLWVKDRKDGRLW